MLIQFAANLFKEGLQRPGKIFFLSPYFPSMNLAVRKSCFDALGGFDPQLKTNEDRDLCLKAHEKGDRLYFTESAPVIHRQREGVIDLLKQWFGYAQYHPALFKRHEQPGVYVIRTIHNDNGSLNFVPLFISFTGGWSIVIFFSPFFLSQVSMASLLISVATLGWNSFGTKAIFLITVVSLIRYLWIDLRWITRGNWIRYILLRFVLNWVVCIGGLMGGIRHKIIWINYSVET